MFTHLFFDCNKCAKDAFCELFVINPFTDAEILKILELMKSFYVASEYSEMVHRGGSNYTKNPAADTIKSNDEYDRINKIVIPAIMQELYKILEDQA